MTHETKPIIGIGIYRRHDNILGECVHAVPMQWSDRDGRPIGVCNLGYDYENIDGLDFGGWVSDYRSTDSHNEPDWPYYHGSTPEYCHVHRINSRRAKVMADLLAKFDKIATKAGAREHGDRFMCFVKAIGATKVWIAKGPDHTDIRQAVEYSLAEGRESYRRLILEARMVTRAKLMPAA